MALRVAIARWSAAIAADESALKRVLPAAAFPIIARPIGSHAGAGLEKLDDAGAVAAYLTAHAAEAFFVSPFIDYASPDGLFRKQRIALWRFGILGPLVSARLEHGDRRAYFELAASRVHEHPDGHVTRLSPRTIEASWGR